MKRQKLNLIKLGLLCLSLLISAVLIQCNGQSVQAMVKNQPFPYAQGVAMDTALYAKVKTRLLAADSLRAASERAIKSLQAEIAATRKALDDQFRLGTYDAAKAKTLLAQLNILQAQLSQAQSTLREARLARESILAELPRKVRKTLELDGTPAQIATATVDYIHLLQTRKWNWLGVGSGVGLVIGLLIGF